MEEEVLRPEPADKSIGDVARRSWVRVEGQEARQSLSVLHARHTAAFQLLLAQQC